jgi:TonB-linked SusC/RagA family outer membrane protein
MKKWTYAGRILRPGFIKTLHIRELVLLLILFGAISANAMPFGGGASSTITGTVTETNGQPLGGVTVKIKGTNTAVNTNSKGNFTISADGNAVLVFSYVGYVDQEIPVNNQTDINVKMALSDKKLDEVVVIGYGTAKKKDLVGAVDVISTKTAGATTATSPAQLIIGKSAGVQVVNTSGVPGSGAQIIIRGTGSFTSVEPLYVIDGIQGNSNLFNTLSAQDIQSITILKDASSTAIYGSAAANGVVLVTTKKSKSGAPRITVTSQWGLAKTPTKLGLLKAKDYVTLFQDIAASKNVVLPGKFNTAAVLNDSTDWQSAVFRNALVSENTVNINGGNEKVFYTFSAGYINQDAIVQDYNNKRLNLRFGLDETVGRFHFGQNLNIRYTKSKGNLANLQNTIGYAPYKPIYDASVPGGYSIVSNVDDFSDVGNPLQPMGINTNISEDFVLYPQLFGEVNLVKGLKFRSQVAATIGSGSGQGYRIPYTASNFLTFDRQATLNNYKYSNYILENYFSYNKDFGKNNISLTVGNSYISPGNSSSLSAAGSGLANDNIRNISVALTQTVTGANVGYASSSVISYYGRLIYDYDSKYILSASIRRDGASNFGTNNKYGNFPGLGFAWKFSQEQFIQHALPFISDGKIRVGWGRTGNNSIPNFLTDVFTYSGSPAGNLVYSLGTNEAFISGTTVNGLPNADLKWEETNQSDAGIDLSFLDNHINFTFDYYDRKSSGLLVSVPLPTSNGIGGVGGQSSSIITNAADAENKGFEMSIGYQSTPSKDFSYNISVNGAVNKNNVNSLGKQFQAPILAGSFNQLSTFTYTAAGSPIGSYYGYRADHVAKDQAEIDALNIAARKATGNSSAVYQDGLLPGDFIFKDIDGDGQLTSKDQQILGSPIPKFIYGINAGVNFKNFDLNIVGAGISGSKILNANKYFTQSATTGHNSSTAMLNRWRKPGDVAALPRAGQNSTASGNLRPSDWWLEDGAYFRLRNLTVGYTIPHDALTSTHVFSSIRFYVAAQNLFTITKYSGYDPEISTQSSNGDYIFTRGFDDGQLPQPRTFLAGVQLGF